MIFINYSEWVTTGKATKKKTNSKKLKTLIESEQDHLASMSTENKISLKIDSKTTNLEVNNQPSAENDKDETGKDEIENAKAELIPIVENCIKEPAIRKKTKVKKNKKADSESRQNISVKSSFSKFDALQKQNLIHVRSADGSKAIEKFSNPQTEKESNCRLCSKPVYKMEEVKAEKSIFHKNCFRCMECNKQLKVDTFQSHEGNLFCIVHFKLLFAPKISTEIEPEKPRRHELIIRENQPEELPPDVVRASNKPDLGLEELSQLNVRSRFHMFENAGQKEEHKSKDERENLNIVIGKRNSTLASKIAKLKQNNCFVGEDTEIYNNGDLSYLDTDDKENDNISDTDDMDIDLVHSRKRTQRERPIGLGDAMSDIKSKFENGHIITKEERREERKQEIQNIRSRLFMGKQARIKEMYQQAVAESEQGFVSAGKKSDTDICCGASTLKERFENGKMFDENIINQENYDKSRNGIVEDAEVFDSAISKKSRSIFMELDANVATGKKNTSTSMKSVNLQKNGSIVLNKCKDEIEPEDHQLEIVKYDEKPADIKIETSEISEKFKFFETYRPLECEKKKFRITPPREGVVKLSSSESDEDIHIEPASKVDNVLEKSQTTSMMLNKFREMELENQFRRNRFHEEPRPLKCFTPPPDGGQRFYEDEDSEFESEEDDDDEEEYENEDKQKEEDEYRSRLYENDNALKEAQLAARAKLLRAKFEKWEANEIEKELNEGPVDACTQQDSNETSIESTRTLRERFENLNKSERKSPIRTRYQVNRFV